MHEKLWENEATMMRMIWQVAKPGHDCGIYLMRHMECYKGEGEGKWHTSFLGKQKNDETCLGRLRYRYLSKLLLSDYNIHKDEVLKMAAEFAKLDVYQKGLLCDQRRASEKRRLEERKDKKKMAEEQAKEGKKKTEMAKAKQTRAGKSKKG